MSTAIDATAVVAGWGKPTKPAPPAPPIAAPPPPRIVPAVDDARILAGMTKPRPTPARSADTLPVADGADFCRNFADVDEVVENVVQRGMVYGCTAPTGHGKTAVLTRKAICISIGQAFGPYPVMKGRVLYLAGENPDDFRARMVATLQEMGVSFDALRGRFFVVHAAFPLATKLDELRALAERITCGARTRTGAPCKRRPVPGKKRCPNHGGLNRPDRTPQGRINAGKGLRDWHAARRAAKAAQSR